MNLAEKLIREKETFFNFMKEKYPVYYKSNLFLRDLEYAILIYFEKKKMKVNYSQISAAAKELIEDMLNKGELKQINGSAYLFLAEFIRENEAVEETVENEESN